MSRGIALALLALANIFDGVSAVGQHYKPHDPVFIVANKVGPFNNPSETFEYYTLPFCRTAGKQKRHHHELGEYLVGDRKVTSPYQVSFLDNVQWFLLCEKTLPPEDVKMFANAIEDDYYFEMFIEDLPMWGYIGEVEGEELLLGHMETAHRYLYPHLHFSIGYNVDQVVSVNVSTNPQRKLDISDDEVDVDVSFSYSVEWVSKPDLKWADRMSRYHDSRFLPGSFEIHWLSIINSLVLVLLLTAFLTIILMRVLKNDFTRYMDVEEDEMGEEESGWKLIHGDVFRFPEHISLFSALVGAGGQLLCTTFLLLFCALTGFFRPTKRGAILTAMIVLYALTSFVGGFISSRLYRQFHGSNWVWNTVINAMVFPAPLSFIFMWVNSVAWSRGSTAALPWHTVMIIVALYLLVSFPLTVIGAIAGRNMSSDFVAPSRTTKVAREIPKDIPWYRQPIAQMFMAGFLPFSAIYIELHYIFASVWGHKIYTLFGILFIAFVMLFIVTSFITVALIYFQLAREDHRWWWRSFFSGGSTGLFIYGYSFFYYFQRSSMDGWLQGSFYFGYMAIISYAFFIMLGFVGFYSSLVFVKHIYGVVKCD